MVLRGANLQHRGQAVKDKFESRRTLRYGRRGQKTRYHQARFLNRTRPVSQFPPSGESRVRNVESLASKLATHCPITLAAVELVKFDTQAMIDPEISGTGWENQVQLDLAGPRERPLDRCRLRGRN